MKCPLCFTQLKVLKDPLYYDCQFCKALIKNYKLLPTPEEEIQRYESHNNDVDDPRYQKFTALIWQYILDHFKPNHSGLDYGCGTGPVISKMLSDQEYNIKKYDPYFYPDKAALNNKYHYIACCEVIEHFFNPIEEFMKLDKMLLPGGMFLGMTLLYNNTIDFEKWAYRKDETHVFIYRKETVKFIANQFNYQLLEMTDRFFVFRKN